MTAVRATLRGLSENLTEPAVVDRDEPPPAQERPRRHAAVLPMPGGSPGTRRYEVLVDGWRFEVEVEPEQRAALRERARRARDDAGHSGPAEVHAIIPGVVVSIAVAAGDAVEAGQQLLVIEAMKMQNELRAPRAGRIERVTVGERAKIEVGDLLVVIE